MENNESVAGFLIILISQIIFFICSFLKFRIIIGYLTVQSFGYYSLVIRLVSLLIPLISCGIGNAFVVYIPYLISKKKNISSFIKSSIKIQIFILTIFSIIFLILSFILDNLFWFNDVLKFRLIIIIGVIISVISQLIYLYLISLQRIKFASLYYSLLGITPTFFILIIFSMNTDSPLSTILWGNYLGIILPIFFFLISSDLTIDKKISQCVNPKKDFVKRVFKEYNLFFIIFTLGYSSLNNIEPFIVNFFLSIEDTSIFSYYLYILSFSFLGSVAIGRLLTPIISRLCNDENNISKVKKENLTRYYKMGINFALWVFILIFLILLDIISLFPNLLEFEKFGGDIKIIYVLGFSGLFYVIAMVNIAFLGARRKMKEAAICINIINILMIVLDIIFIPIWGISGLIFTKIIINFGFLVLTLFLNKKIIFIKKTFKIIAVVFLNYFIQFLTCFFNLHINIFVLGFVNLICLIFFLQNKAFWEFLKNFFRKNLKK